MNTLLSLVSVLLLGGTTLAAQETAPEVTTPEAPESAEAAAPAEPAPANQAYTIGVGDVLEVEVFGNDDLSRTATVQTNGTIALPLLGEVEVATLTPRDAAARLAELLGRDYLVNPQVEVRVKEYRSQIVSVVGEVQRPNRYAIKGRMRLIDALVEAGGLSARASGEVTVTRVNGTFPSGEATLTVRLGGPLSPETQRLIETELENGDIVNASLRHYVTVEGEVQRPNRYAIEGELTVTGAVTLAGGLTRYGSNDLTIRRFYPATGKTEILEIDLKDIRKGKQPDIVLMPNDVITVSRRLF